MKMKKENKFISAAKRGFTLVELLVVVAILGILGSIAIVNVAGHIDNARKTKAEVQVRDISGVISSNYMNTHSEPPSNLRVLIEERSDGSVYLEGGEGALYDPWDNEYRIVKKGKRFAIVSNGPDGMPDTDDDIRSDKIERKKKD